MGGVSIAGLEVVTVEARIVVASIETYLQHSEALGASRRASLPREKTWATGAALASAAGSRGLDRSGGPRNKPSAAIPLDQLNARNADRAGRVRMNHWTIIDTNACPATHEWKVRLAGTGIAMTARTHHLADGPLHEGTMGSAAV